MMKSRCKTDEQHVYDNSTCSLPDAVSWWPPAPGWWIVFITCLLIVLGAYLFFKHRKNRVVKPDYKKLALKELKELQKQLKEE